MRNTRLEAQILSSVDELVQCAISAGLKGGEEREEEINRGIALIKVMGDLLAEALEGRIEHMQALLEQLVAQRLPDRRVLQSFGNFSRDLQEIITRGVAEYRSSKSIPDEEVVTPPEQATTETITENLAATETTTNQGQKSCFKEQEELWPAALTVTLSTAPLKNLRLALERAYPGEEIIENFTTRGGKLAFFLPRLNLGFEIASQQQDWRKEFFYRQAGITVINVVEEELMNPFLLLAVCGYSGFLAPQNNLLTKQFSQC